MSKYSNFSYSTVPHIYRRRNVFPIPFERLTSMKMGELTPIAVIEIYPGDTIYGNVGNISRLLNAYYKPVVGSTFIDTHAFFSPLRLVYDRWEEVMGENKQSAWAQQSPVAVPTFDDLPQQKVAHVKTDSVFDHLYACPPATYHTPTFNLSVLPARAFALIYDTWYRNENVTAPMHIQKGEVTEAELPNGNPWAPNNYCGYLPKVNKIKDRFTSALPAPQKGDVVDIMGGAAIPVVPSADDDIRKYGSVTAQLRWANTNTPWDGSGESGIQTGAPFILRNTPGRANTWLYPETPPDSSGTPVFPTNLFAVPGANAVDVSSLRMAVQTQRILERSARYGTRYLTEYIPSAWGIQSRAAMSVLPEYICGWRSPMGAYQVPQTATDTNGTGVADLAAFGHSQGGGRISKSFTEHGYLIFCASIRQIHVYQQGIDPLFFRKNRFDFYDTEFARISEQPIYVRELYFIDNAVNNEMIFGYQEPWAELRSATSHITGQMRSGALLRDGETQANFDLWHFGDDYSNRPTLTDPFIQEDSTFFDRTVQNLPANGDMDEFLVQFYFNLKVARELPIRGEPGLVDHTYK